MPTEEQGPGDEIRACPAGYMTHTPPPTPQPAPVVSSSSMAGYPTREELAAQQQQLEQHAAELREREERLLGLETRHLPAKKERKPPVRSGSAASLFSPFASLSRRLGAKHKAPKTPGRMSTPVEACLYANCGPVERPARSLASIYSTLPRKHSSSGSSASGRPGFAFGQPASGSGGSSSTAGPCPSCPSPSCSSSSRLSSAGAPFVMTEILDEPVEEEVSRWRSRALISIIGPIDAALSIVPA